MMSIIIAFIIGAISLISLSLAVFTIYKKWPYFRMDSTRTVNDDQLATNSFIELLEEAESKISIFDNGNIMEGSIYENEDVIKRVGQKLEENPDFKIECSFKYDENTRFKEEFSGHPQVTIIKRDPLLAHYKIIDGGKKAYLSRHGVAAKSRDIMRYDFSSVKVGRRQVDVKKEYIGEYLEDINRTFQSAVS